MPDEKKEVKKFANFRVISVVRPPSKTKKIAKKIEEMLIDSVVVNGGEIFDIDNSFHFTIHGDSLVELGGIARLFSFDHTDEIIVREIAAVGQATDSVPQYTTAWSFKMESCVLDGAKELKVFNRITKKFENQLVCTIKYNVGTITSGTYKETDEDFELLSSIYLYRNDIK